MNGHDPDLAAQWVGGGEEGRLMRAALERRLSKIEVRDDFVEIPRPQFAAAAPAGPAVREAVRKFEKEAQVVDARLFQKVSLRLRQVPMSDLCEALRQKTGIPFTASRSVADENVTLFVKEVPVRDVMRAVARLFVYRWGRLGEQPEYRYELRQDLRAQIAEEELRNRQVNEALLELDGKLAAYQPYLELSPEKIQQGFERSQVPEKYLFRDLSTWEWGAIQLYHRLSPAQRQALAEGEQLQFRTDARQPELRLPTEWRDSLLKRMEFVVGTIGGQQSIGASGLFDGPNGPGATTPLAGLPGAEVEIRLSIDGLQQGKLLLQTFTVAHLLKPDGSEAALSGSKGGVLASVQSPFAARPRNATLNAKLRGTGTFQQLVSIRPTPSCPWFSPERRPKRFSGLRVQPEPGGEKLYLDLEGQIRSGEEPAHVTTADVWEAIHNATGTPVVADSYSRLFDAKMLEVEPMSRFDALCRLGDRMGVRWQQDGQFLLGRSTTYLWDKVKEVPARHLRRWQADYNEHGFLPLDDLLEAATLPDRQLDAVSMGQVIGHCWGLEDWIIVGEGASLPIGILPSAEVRPYARLLALLSAGQRDRAQQQGLTFDELQPAQQQALLELLMKERRAPREVLGLRFRVDYAPAGTFVWNPTAGTQAEADQLERTVPFIWGKTAEETLTAVCRVYAGARPEQIQRSHGMLVLSFTNPTTGTSWKAGRVGVRIETGG